MSPMLESTDAKNKLEDLSGIKLEPGENPYKSLIEACDDDPVRDGSFTSSLRDGATLSSRDLKKKKKEGVRRGNRSIVRATAHPRREGIATRRATKDDASQAVGLVFLLKEESLGLSFGELGCKDANKA